MKTLIAVVILLLLINSCLDGGTDSTEKAEKGVQEFDKKEQASVSLGVLCSTIASSGHHCEIDGKTAYTVIDTYKSELPGMCQVIKELARENGMAFAIGEAVGITTLEYGGFLRCKLR